MHEDAVTPASTGDEHEHAAVLDHTHANAPGRSEGSREHRTS
jgi:hypothetical protein